MKQLVTNGCSYMNHYAIGHGHLDLANQLNIPGAVDLSSPGSCNDRIIRTTIRHSYQTKVPTFYVLGMTFLNRTELPILKDPINGEHWISFQNFAFKENWAWPWTDKDTEQFIELYLKSQFANMKDRAEDLMYKLLALIASLRRRGHRVLIFQQAENRYQEFLDSLSLYYSTTEFVDGFAWRAIPWQLNQGAKPIDVDVKNLSIPRDMLHVSPGQHSRLNEFLTKYIQENKIIE